MSIDDYSLPQHAADKVKRALDDVLCLTDDLGEKLRIALMATSIPIGAAGAILAVKMRREGHECTQVQANRALFKLLEAAAVDGTDAAVSMMTRQKTATAEHE